MTRNYGNLRSRRSGGGWQWMVMGFVIGFGCAAVIGLAIVIGGTSGLLNGGFLTAFGATNTPVIITATPLPATNTPLPTEVLIEPSATPQQVQVVAPTATTVPPTPDPASIQVLPSITPSPTTSVLPTLPVATNPEASIPPELLAIRTQTRRVDGNTFLMGTTTTEVSNAVNQCVTVFEGNCTAGDAQDSFPAHPVTVNSFEMEVTEVTYEQYLTYLNSSVMGPNSHRNRCEGQICLATRAEDPSSNIIFDSANYRVLDVIKNFPVVNVTWYGAQAYCHAIGRRLPTEAEWEYAARGPQAYIYPWGNDFTTDLAKTSRPRTDQPGSGPVDGYPGGASLFGMLNMAGNAAEWVSDWYSPTYYSELAQSGATAINPQGPPAGTDKVVRGGSWDTPPFFSRSVHRQNEKPINETVWLGFRCAADVTDSTGNAGLNTLGQTTTTNTGSGNEETTANSQPTLPPLPPTATLQPG